MICLDEREIWKVIGLFQIIHMRGLKEYRCLIGGLVNYDSWTWMPEV